MVYHRHVFMIVILCIFIIILAIIPFIFTIIIIITINIIIIIKNVVLNTSSCEFSRDHYQNCVCFPEPPVIIFIVIHNHEICFTESIITSILLSDRVWLSTQPAPMHRILEAHPLIHRTVKDHPLDKPCHPCSSCLPPTGSTLSSTCPNSSLSSLYCWFPSLWLFLCLGS